MQAILNMNVEDGKHRAITIEVFEVGENPPAAVRQLNDQIRRELIGLLPRMYEQPKLSSLNMDVKLDTSAIDEATEKAKELIRLCSDIPINVSIERQW